MPDSCLDDDLAALDPALLAQLQSQGFDAARLRGWEHDLLRAGPEVNRVAGVVAAPAAGDVSDLPERGSPEGRQLERLGLDALGDGRLAMVVLAGGMATRMGGVVKGLVEAIPRATFLEARLAEREYWQRLGGAQLPMWLMTLRNASGFSHATVKAAMPHSLQDLVVKAPIATGEREEYRDERAEIAASITAYALPGA